MALLCHSNHPLATLATHEITLYERPTEEARTAHAQLEAAALVSATPRPEALRPRATWRGLCCPPCLEQGLALLKRQTPAHCLLLVLPVRE